jgi:cellulose synthase/poly-beta-1,6-N-acetylglucosamine synthase-like glycosyltransferase
MTASETVFLSFYLVLMAILSAVALHRLVLALAARSHRREPAVTPPASWPSVLVQLPLYNERFVAERVIDMACRFDYPRDRLTVQVLDDSTDGTSAIVAAAVERWQQQGVAIEHVRRTHRAAYKAGALAAGLLRTEAEFVAVFDADFAPPPDLLKKIIPEFSDPKVGMVQARWGHLNRTDSILTEAEAILLNGHFANEHGGRFARHCFFNFNGTAGLWRVAAIADAGGWSGSTLTEDLDLSYRAQLRGWRFVYREDVAVPGELPDDVQAFKTQQHRWAKGSIQTAMQLLTRIIESPLPWRIKGEAVFHLAANFAYPLVLLLTVLMPFAVTIRVQTQSWAVFIVDCLFFLGSTVSLVVFYMMAECRIGSGWKALKHLPVVLAMGIGMAVNNSRAVIEALMARQTAFNRTPKLGGHAAASICDPGYFVDADWQSIIELVLGAYLLGAVLAAADAGRWVAVPFLALFAGGFLFLALGSLWNASLFGRGRAPAKALTAPAMPKRI